MWAAKQISGLGFIILYTHIIDQTWEKEQYYCSTGLDLAALSNMQIRLQFGLFALTLLTMRERVFGSDHSGRKNSVLSGFTIIEALK